MHSRRVSLVGTEGLFLSDFPRGGRKLGETRGKKGVSVGREETVGVGGPGWGQQVLKSGVKQSRVDAAEGVKGGPGVAPGDQCRRAESSFLGGAVLRRRIAKHRLGSERSMNS